MGIVDDFLKGLPVNPVLREKVSEMNSTIDRLTETNASLEKENSDLVAENAKLRQQFSEQKASASEFTDTRGLKIKKLPTGGYVETVAYCPHCYSPLSSSHRMKVLECSKCGYKTSIQARHLSIVVSELKGEKLPEWLKW
jgi:ribosomal protein L37AE/L43A